MALYAVPTEPVEPVESITGYDLMTDFHAMLKAGLPGVATDDPAREHLVTMTNARGPFLTIAGSVEPTTGKALLERAVAMLEERYPLVVADDQNSVGQTLRLMRGMTKIL